MQLTKLAEPGIWVVTSGSLPDGVTLNANTGLVSGTPTRTEDSPFTVTFTETLSLASVSKELDIHVEPAPVINTTSISRRHRDGLLQPAADQDRPARFLVDHVGLVADGPDPADVDRRDQRYADHARHLGVHRHLHRVLERAATSRALSIQIDELPPVINTTSLPDGTQTVDYSTTLSKTGRTGTWSVTSGTLPAGLTLNPTTGVISGTPTATGDFDFTIRFTVASGLFDSQPLSIHIEAAPTIVTTSLPDGVENTAYNAQLTKTGRAGTWSIINGTLPAGLTLNATTGAISGTPTTPGDNSFTARFIETISGATVSRPLSIQIDELPPVINTTSLPDGTQTVAYSATLSKTGRAGSWSVSVGNLPGGLSLNAGTGAITGTASTAGDFDFTVTFTVTSSGLTDSQPLSIHIEAAPTIVTTSLPDGLENNPYSGQLTKTGRTGTWSIVTGGLPTGLSLSSTTGAISGTPTTPGDFGFTARFTETVSGAVVSKALSIQIAEAPPVIHTTSLPNGTEGTAYSTTLSKSGRTGTWSVTTGSLPSGLSLNPTTGSITGTPATQGDSAFTVTYTVTASGLNDSQALSIHVNAIPPVITTTVLPIATRNAAYSAPVVRTGEAGTWSVTTGTLPTGLTLNANTGVISGTPTALGDSFFTLTFTETATSLSDAQALTIHVAPAGGPVITTPSLPTAKVGVNFSVPLVGQNSVGGGTWSSIVKPAWVNLTAAGVLSGTPPAAGDFTITVRFTVLLPLLAFDQRTYILHVNP